MRRGEEGGRKMEKRARNEGMREKLRQEIKGEKEGKQTV